MPAPTTFLVQEQSCSVTTDRQLVTTSIKSESNWLSLLSYKSHIVN